MDDPFDIWKKGIAGFPTYKKDFDLAMSYTVDDGFRNQPDEDEERFSHEFKREESEREERVLSGESDSSHDEAFFSRIRHIPKSKGNIFGDGDDGGMSIFNDNVGRQGGIFGKRKTKKKGFFSGF